MAEDPNPIGNEHPASTRRIAVVGTVGVPANYGGFETLTDNLLRRHEARRVDGGGQDVLEFSVYCSAQAYDQKLDRYHGAELVYLPLSANGLQSIAYDIWSVLSALRRGSDAVLVLGVSGAVALLFARLFSRTRVVTNIDGIEWQREKWSPLAKRLLKFLEWCAVRFSHVVIADNQSIADYVRNTYGVGVSVIAYGGDHALQCDAEPLDDLDLPDRYALSVARVEPENNAGMILEAFADRLDCHLVMVGNWDRSEYGRAIRRRYSGCRNVRLLDPIYDLGRLKSLRSQAQFYVHGHSAGGTNPSLVEAMHFEVPVVAFDCVYNRSTTEEQALYFRDAEHLRSLIRETDTATLTRVAASMKEIAGRRYTWDTVASQYFELLQR